MMLNFLEKNKALSLFITFAPNIVKEFIDFYPENWYDNEDNDKSWVSMPFLRIDRQD